MVSTVTQRESRERRRAVMVGSTVVNKAHVIHDLIQIWMKLLVIK